MNTFVAATVANSCAYRSPSTCDADAACSWCVSFAVPSTCYTLDDAAALPGGVFECDKTSEALSTVEIIDQPLEYTAEMAVNKKEVIQFVSGLFHGLVKEDHLWHINSCVKDVRSADRDVTSILRDLHRNDVKNIFDAVTHVGHLIGALKHDLHDCVGMKRDFARVEKWAQIFKSPTKLAEKAVKNVWKHLPQVQKDVKSIMKGAAHDRFREVGWEVADILVVALGPVGRHGEESLF